MRAGCVVGRRAAEEGKQRSEDFPFMTLRDKERRKGEIWYLVFALALATIVNIQNHESLRN